MLTLRGAPALSAFRLNKLAQRISGIHPEIQLLHTEYVHFAQLHGPLSSEQEGVLTSLLAYGPELTIVNTDELVGTALLLVVPRPGTISPWSSKATDIAHNCGLCEVERLERGLALYLSLLHI